MSKHEKSVGVCTEMDSIMHRMLRRYPRCRAVVYKSGVRKTVKR